MIRIYFKFSWIAVFFCVCVVFTPLRTEAHRPHDDIRSIGISPEFSKDGTAFIIMHNSMVLKRTTNFGATWNWLNKGLDYVQRFTDVAVSPAFQADGTVFVGSGTDGIFKSVDRGNGWTKINKGIDGINIQRMWVSPHFATDNIIVAADGEGKIFISRDSGGHWELFYESQAKITDLSFFPRPSKIDIIVGDQKGFLHRFSQEGGWNEVQPLPGCGAITAIAVSPLFQKDNTLWVGTEKSGVLTSADSGVSFKQANTGIGDEHITALAVKTDDDEKIKLWATTWYEAIFKSESGGSQWTKYDQGLSTDPQADAPDFLQPHFSVITQQGDYLLLGAFDGLFVSKNDGQNWRQFEIWPLRNISVFSLSPPIGKEKRQSGFLAYAGGACLIPNIRETDWVDEAKSLTLAGTPGRRTDSGISDVVFSPAYDKDHTIFAATEHELIKSSDSGKNWTRVNVKEPIMMRVRKKLNRYMRKAGVSSDLRLKIVGFFPLIPGWSTYAALSPGYDKDGTVFFGTQGVGLCLSTDWGESCSVIFDTDLKLTTSMAISPAFSKDKTIFIGIKGEGIYRSKDGGDTFIQTNNGLEASGEIKLAISPEYPLDHLLMAGTGDGLFISTDSGEKWEHRKNNGLPDHGAVLSIAISPNFKSDSTVILTIQGGGIYKSADGGNIFTAVGTELIQKNEQLKQIRFSSGYAKDNTLYGVSNDNVYRSSDGGFSWQLIERPVRYEDVWDVIRYEGDWELVNGGQYSDSTITRSKTRGNKATLRFFGSKIRWISDKSPESGYADVYIDGQKIKEISLTENPSMTPEYVFTSENLDEGLHEISIEVSREIPDRGWVAIDAFEIIP